MVNRIRERSVNTHLYSMAENHIQQKKPSYPVQALLSDYLKAVSRNIEIPLGYNDLMRYDGLMAQIDDKGNETLWNTVMYGPSELADIHEKLVYTYQLLVADGRPMKHLAVASVDFCGYGNSQPFRVKILNQINDNHDYYYIKKADASRVYGLELEHLLSPNKINYIYHQETLIEEHIIGVPGDDFIKSPSAFGSNVNEVRLAKEFVKFNERCFVRLLGDMRAYNFVVVVTQDFDQVAYRLRSIDFDQQSFEGRSRIYLPQFYKENLPFVKFAQNRMNLETAEQYMNEERSLLRKRYHSSKDELVPLIAAMKQDTISKPEHVDMLRTDLARLLGDTNMRNCRNMGEILERHIKKRLEL